MNKRSVSTGDKTRAPHFTAASESGVFRRVVKISCKLIMLTMVTIMAAGCGSQEKNPLLRDFSGIHGTPTFTEIKNEHYLPAFKKAIEEARSEVDAIVSNTDAPTFANTIEALEFCGGRLDAISAIFFNLNEANTSDQMQQIALEVSPMLTQFSNDINLNPALFERVKLVYNSIDSLPLSDEQRMLLNKRYKRFTRGGAALNQADQASYRAISEELSELSLKFDQNTLAATNAYFLTVTDPRIVAELPDFVKEGAAEEAKAKGVEGWVFTLQAPSMIPFMTYSSNRGLKEELWRKYNARAFGGSNDNREIVKRIVDLRLAQAKLLGYPTYADYVLEERMAGGREEVDKFLAQMLDKGVAGARADLSLVQNYAHELGADYELMPWDFAYYSELLKDNKYSVSDELVKPYFSVEGAQRGLFELANKLFGITFTQNDSIDVYHPDVKAFEVKDADGSFLAVLYMDYFPRESKRGGAWMTEFRSQYIKNGVEVRPLVSVVCNFTKPTQSTPSLLTFDEVTTLLHEFGHAMHGIAAQGSYPSLTGTSVYRDFVELPSQLFENWALEKEFLDKWATHYQTGENMPAELVQKLVDARNYNAAYLHIRQVSFGLGDMAWHTLREPFVGEVEDFERAAISKAQVLPYVKGQCMATSFGHIFSGGYAAGYYSYKWAEVLEADAFSLFQERGIFNAEVAASYRENILSKGGSVHPMELYIRFRGDKPNADALFEKMGMK